jgi:hypothetical protein
MNLKEVEKTDKHFSRGDGDVASEDYKLFLF